jgi:hypothetical protein
MLEHALPLAGWESFYVITGSSGAALTGLMFVVIALAADKSQGKEGGIKAFGTPTIVHFCVVLLIAAVLTTPEHTALTLGLCLTAIGVGGLAYARRNWKHIRAQQDYKPDREDWTWFMILPLVAYLSVLVAGVLVWTGSAAGLYLTGAAVLLLLFTGVHNAWDSAVYLGIRQPPS